MITLQDVAREAQVSIATASKALSADPVSYRISEASRQRVLEACRNLGYRPNNLGRSLQSGKSGAIGSLLGSHIEAYENIPLWSQLNAGMTSAALARGYQLVTLGAHRSGEAIECGLQALGERRIDGLLVPTHLCTPAVVRKLSEATAPIVLAAWPKRCKLPTIEVDDRAGMEKLVEHLCELGHRRFLWVTPGEPGCIYEKRRRAAFAACLGQRGFSGEFVKIGYSTKELIPKEQQIAATREKLLATERETLRRATAVVAYHEPVALGVYAAAAELGLRIPDDLSVCSFDDIYATVAYPPMTVVSLAMYEVGIKAVEVLLEMIDHPAERERLRGARHHVPSHLVIRKSTAAPRETPR